MKLCSVGPAHPKTSCVLRGKFKICPTHATVSWETFMCIEEH